MKIAIIGQDDKKKTEIIHKFLELSTNYGKPANSVHDEAIEVTEGLKYNEEWNDAERELYERMSFITTQMDKYTDKDNIIYCGHSMDVLAEAMVMYSIEEVSEDFVEKMIYWNQRLMKKLDLIYWLPSSERFIAPKENEDEEVDFDVWYQSQLEIIYNNFWNDYISNFDHSEILPRECPGMGIFESNTPAAELADIVQDLDTMDDEGKRMDDIAKLDRLIKDKKLLDQMKEALMQNTIPLPSGEFVSSGGISL